MNRLILAAASLGLLCASSAASAAGEYNDVPAGDALSDSDKGKATSKTCEKYSDWGS